MGDAARRERPRRHALWRGARPDRRPDGPPARIRRRLGASLAGRYRPLPATSCGRPTTLAAGSHLLIAAPGPYAVDVLALRSPAGSVAVTTTGQVLSPGTFGRGFHTGVRVSVRGPPGSCSARGTTAGWPASCDGHTLGRTGADRRLRQRVAGRSGCHRRAVRLRSEPVATIGYVVSGVAGLLVLVLLGWPLGAPPPPPGRPDSQRADPPRGRPTARAHPGPRPRLGDPRRLRVRLRLRCASRGRVRARARADPVARRRPRPLTLAAGALLGIVVPLLYIVDAPSAAGGNHYGYATQHMTAHWVAVAALGFLFVALWRTLIGSRKVSSA